MSNARIKDPRAVAVVGTDAHLPALPACRLTVDAIRQQLYLAAQAGSAMQPEFAGDGTRFGSVRAPTPAAVLLLLVPRAGGLHVLLTQRSQALRDHAGQISLPGGRCDPGDVNAAATALREADEEVGLPSRQVEVLALLPVYTTVTQYSVTPVVALAHGEFELRLDSDEVAEAFEVPLAFLMNPAHHQRHHFELDGAQRQFLSMPWRAGVGSSLANPGREYFIWGATAAMLRNFYRVLAFVGAPTQVATPAHLS